MITKRWKDLLFGFVLLALLPAAGTQANPLDPALEAAVLANDVDAVAAALASMAASGDDDAALATAMEEVAQLNPDIAGAVVNATVRTLAASGVGAVSLAPTINTLVTGAMSGVAGSITADDVTTYAENIATNVRQAVGAVAGGDRRTENVLLASARSGVAQSAARMRDTGSSGQILRTDVSVRLQGRLDPEESEEAVEADPIVVTHTDPQPTPTPDPDPQPTPQPTPDPDPTPTPTPDPTPTPQPTPEPTPIVPEDDDTVQEQPQVDVPDASPH